MNIQKSSSPFSKKVLIAEYDREDRTSAAGRQNGKHSETLHFVSYEYLFKYLFDLLNGGNFANAYLKSHEQMDEIFVGNKSGMYKKVFHKAFEIFIHALKFPKNAMYCEKCPGELIEGQTEDLFEGEIEVSIIDGVNMGCIQNAAKGFVDQDNFEEEKVDDIVIAGVEAKDRTFVNLKSQRDILKNLHKSFSKSTLKAAIKKFSKTKTDDCSQTVLDLLIYMEKFHLVPEGYQILVKELSLETPVSALLTAYSSNRKLYQNFLNYLESKRDIFSNLKNVEQFQNNFPIILEIQRKITKETSSIFLPPAVSDIFLKMIELRVKFDKLSRKVAPAQVYPHGNFKEPGGDCFPSYKIHTMDNHYKADKIQDKSEDFDCDKNFYESATITGGLGTLSCAHKIVKGFRAIKKGESPLLFADALLRRLPKSVQSQRRVVCYDYACKMHKCCLRRYPYRIRRHQFVVDRHHQSNHTTCSAAYDMSRYLYLDEINSQIAEQLNNSLRKLSTVLAYSKFENYMKIVEVFVSVKNLQLKGSIK